MSEFRRVTEVFAVSPQVNLDDVSRAAAEGFVLLINNRPDGEAPDQPTSAQVEAAAKAFGMAYRYIPVSGQPIPAQVDQMREALTDAGGPVLAFCRSGNRSIVTWAVGEVMAGADRADLAMKAARAGYDLRPLLGV